jgi:hypothetical protein
MPCSEGRKKMGSFYMEKTKVALAFVYCNDNNMKESIYIPLKFILYASGVFSGCRWRNGLQL